MSDLVGRGLEAPVGDSGVAVGLVDPGLGTMVGVTVDLDLVGLGSGDGVCDEPEVPVGPVGPDGCAGGGAGDGRTITNAASTPPKTTSRTNDDVRSRPPSTAIGAFGISCRPAAATRPDP